MSMKGTGLVSHAVGPDPSAAFNVRIAAPLPSKRTAAFSIRATASIRFSRQPQYPKTLQAGHRERGQPPKKQAPFKRTRSAAQFRLLGQQEEISSGPDFRFEQL